jgi:hypothetical protein
LFQKSAGCAGEAAQSMRERLLIRPACEKVSLMERIELTSEQLAWAERVEPLWRRAHASSRIGLIST